MTGSKIPALEPIDRLISDFMLKYQVPGGAVGFVKDGRLVYARGFGYADTNTLELVQPDSLFRIASISKPFTAVAVLRLVDQGRLRLDEPILPLLNCPSPTYAGAARDPRWEKVTVRHLLNHAGGWDRDVAVDPDGDKGFDPTVNWTVRAAKDMGTAAPADATTIVRWMLGKPLQFEPGTRYRYSNFGYTLLGRVIEKRSGMSYERFVQELLQEAGISRMRIGGSRQTDRLPGEVVYYDYPGNSLTQSIFPQDTTPVPWPYNFSYRTMDSHGGWVASTLDLLRFVTAVDARTGHKSLLSAMSLSNMLARPSPPWKPSEEPYYGMGWQVRSTPGNWWHDGSLPGTRTEVVRAGNGFSWAILFNTRAERDGEFYAEMDRLGWNALSAVSHWPTNDLFDSTLSYEAWRRKHFTAEQLLDPKISGDRADPDGDGLPNLVEYASGRDPNRADRAPLITPGLQEIEGKSYATVTFTRLLLAHEVAYLLETSDDLNHWTTAGQQTGEPQLNGDGTLTVTWRDQVPAPPHGRKYLRMRFERRPQ